jgi:Tol biopolymer transport system component
MPFRLSRAAGLALAALLLLLPAALGAQIPSDARWRTFTTPHFRVHFTEGLEPLARRAGERAETAHALLEEAFVPGPRGRIDLLVTDNVDYANGFAGAIPRNRIVVFAHPPADEPSLAFYDDWMELVITHELVHIFHLDHASGLPRALRRVLGRNVAAFPNFNVPDWTIEGMATYLESRLTQSGRVRATMHEIAVRTAVLEGEFFPLDRASGDPASWPGANTSYVYGSLFLTWLADRHAEDDAGELVRIYGARVVPYLLDRAARRAYGESFTRAWGEWRAELQARYAALADSLGRRGITEPEILTTAGHRAEFPRFSPDGRRIAYSAATGREEASTRVVEADGRERVLASRTTLGPSSWAADGETLVTSMVDVVRPARYHADLFVIDADGGRERRTRSARVWHPDVARDGRVVAVRSAPGTNALVVMDSVDAEPRELAAPSMDVNWATPRWSPDGRRIAASRWRAGGRYDVVILDAASGRVVAEATDDRAVDRSSAWSPDGRWVVFSSDRTGIANLYAYEVATGRLRQVTNVLTGAFDPDVSPDGRTLVFAYYRADGYHVARLPFDPATWRDAPPAPRTEGPDPARYQRTVEAPSTRYSPWRTLPPTGWTPTADRGDVLGTRLGALVAGRDVVERHSYAASAFVYPESGRTEGGVGYLYQGLGNPTLGASVFQDWDVIGRAGAFSGPDDQPIPTALLERERAAYLVASFTRPRFRSYNWLSAGASLRQREREWDDGDVAPANLLTDIPPEVGGVVTLGHSTARAYDFSIGPQDGMVAAASLEGRRFTRALEGDDEVRGYVRSTARAQFYRGFDAWGFAHHVIALRAAAGADAGSRAPGYSLGGEGGLGTGGVLGTAFGLGSELDYPLRGYPTGAQYGDRVAVGTAEYRFPLALVERGAGLIPLYLDRLWGTAFADAGAAWCLEICDDLEGTAREADPLYSVGTELGADVTLGFNLRMRLRVGLAFPLSEIPTTDGGRARPNPEFYFTFGQAF